MRLEMGGIDHQLIGLTALGRQLGEDPVEHAQTATANERVVDRLVRTVAGRCITPAQPVPDTEDDAAHDAPVIDPWNAVRQREIRLGPAHLRLAQHPDLRQQQRLLSTAIYANELMGPELKEPRLDRPALTPRIPASDRSHTCKAEDSRFFKGTT